MKTIIFVSILIISTINYSQTSLSILNLKHQTQGTVQHQASTIQHQPFSIKHQASSIQHPSRKSGFTAVLYSLLLPGMGELYAGNYNSGKYFTIAEGALWGFWAGFNMYGDWQQENYKSFAAAQGGVNPEGKDDTYYAEISKYVDIDAYNKDKSLSRSYEEMYDPKVYFWKWKNQDERREYRNIWLSSERSYNNIRFAVGAMVVNRIVSAINAALSVKRYNKNLDVQTGWNFSMDIIQSENFSPEVKLNMFTSF